MESEPPTSPSARDERFRVIYDAAYLDLLRFIRRRLHPSLAEDVAADVMLTAWRRLDDLPPDLSDARAWLFGTARKSILNARRGTNRREALAVRLVEESENASGTGDHAELVTRRLDVASAWAQLDASQQETIALSVIDGLATSDAASVLGVSSVAYRLRLSRARRSLRRLVESDDLEAPVRSVSPERNLR